MARTALAVTALSANGGVATASTAIDQANGMTVAGYGALRSNKLFFIVSNTAATPGSVIVRTGAYPVDTPSGPAFRAKRGDLTVAIPASSSIVLGPLESARFDQADDSLSIDFGAGTTGTISAYLAPQGI